MLGFLEKKVLKSTFLQSIYYTVGARVGLIIMSLLSAIITARILAPEDRGYLFYAMTLGATITQFINLGIHSSNARFVAKDPTLFSVLSANSLWISVIFASILIPIFLFANSIGIFASNIPFLSVLLGVSIVPFLLYYLLSTNLIVGLEKFKTLSFLELTNRGIGLLLFTFCLLINAGLSGVLFAWFICAILASFRLIYIIYKHGGKLKPNWHIFRSHLPYGFRSYIAALLPFLMVRYAVFEIESLPDKNQLGYWSVASRIGELLLIIPSSVSMVLFPRLVKTENSFMQTLRVAGIVSLIMAITCVVIYYFGEFFILTLFGFDYGPAIELLKLYLPTILLLSIISVFSQFLASVGMPYLLLIIWGAGLLITIFINKVCNLGEGVSGTLYSMTVAHIFVFISISILVLYKGNTLKN